MTRPPTCPARPRRLRALTLVLALALSVAAACQPAPEPPIAPPHEPGDLGWEGPAFTGASGSPSGSKPESKVWFNDGIWWGSLWDVSLGGHYIHRLDTTTGRWSSTGVRLDTRASGRADVLWDGTKLYVASHRFAEGASTTPTGDPARLWRFSYDPPSDTYSLDAGFPVQINDARSETLVIDKDTTGRLWATWVQDRKVMVSQSSIGGTTWGTPFVVPTGNTTVASDDISSLVAFSPGRIGVLWSNQTDNTFYFAHRSDGAPLGTWAPAEVAYTGPSTADDHINLASVNDQDGRILAAVKTSRTQTNPLTVLIDRNPVSGTWQHHTFGTGIDSHTRPVVAVNRTDGLAHMFATAGQSGGTIYEKRAPLAALGFAPGLGTPVMTDATSADINNPTTTKQSVDATTGLVVLATNDSTRQYWTHYDNLGGRSKPTPQPVASMTATPSSDEPRTVRFQSTSTGHPHLTLWGFGDGSTAWGTDVWHQYAAPGTYTVQLLVAIPNRHLSSTTTATVTVP